MWTFTVYERPKGRRPVRLRISPFPQDPQQRLPDGWCPGCGAELFGRRLCRRCEGGTEDEGKSLQSVQPGEMPRCL